MELRGKNHIQNVIAVIPARYNSTRLEGKLLRLINGKPLILHTLEQTKKAQSVSRTIVATDDKRIFRAVEESGGEAVMTSTGHESGSDRIAEVAGHLPENSIIVNVQGDEPLISPISIERAVDAFVSDETADMATVFENISDYRDVIDPNIVKVVLDSENYAVYFSRSPIPFPRDAVMEYGNLENALMEKQEILSLFKKHTGLYVYRREFLLKFLRLEKTNLERVEMLEQLRALEHGARIKVVEAHSNSIGVDTMADLERAERVLTGVEAV